MIVNALIVSASIAVGATAIMAPVNVPAAAVTAEAADGSYEVAGLAWRCPKSNPVAEWGTIGNGCLKQRLAAKKKGSASAVGDNLTIGTQAPPPPPPKKRLAQ